MGQYIISRSPSLHYGFVSDGLICSRVEILLRYIAFRASSLCSLAETCDTYIGEVRSLLSLSHILLPEDNLELERPMSSPFATPPLIHSWRGGRRRHFHGGRVIVVGWDFVRHRAIRRPHYGTTPKDVRARWPSGVPAQRTRRRTWQRVRQGEARVPESEVAT